MNPTVKANTEIAGVNRDLLLEFVGMQLDQNKKSAATMRSLAIAVSAHADDLEAQRDEAEVKLNALVGRLEQSASSALRQRASIALKAAADAIKKMIEDYKRV